MHLVVEDEGALGRRRHSMTAVCHVGNLVCGVLVLVPPHVPSWWCMKAVIFPTRGPSGKLISPSRGQTSELGQSSATVLYPGTASARKRIA